MANYRVEARYPDRSRTKLHAGQDALEQIDKSKVTVDMVSSPLARWRVFPTEEGALTVQDGFRSVRINHGYLTFTPEGSEGEWNPKEVVFSDALPRGVRFVKENLDLLVVTQTDPNL